MEKTDLERFINLKNLTDVSILLEISEDNLKLLLYRIPLDKRYKEFDIIQKNNKIRHIQAPDNRLKQLQRKLLYFLELLYKPKKNTYGFVKGKSIKHNAVNHTRKRHVLNIDLKDFFPSINFGRVRGLFLKEPFNFSAEVATILAQIACHKGLLPQGSPTSPIISNFICHKLDNQLNKIAQKCKVSYTRYADDITFSSELRIFPKEIAEIVEGHVELNPILVKVVEGNGFIINADKVKYSGTYNRQEVTGLVVNKFPNVKRTYVRQIRAMIHAWQKYGYRASNKEYIKKYLTPNSRSSPNRYTFKMVIKGKLEFIRQIKGSNDKVYLNLITKANKLDPKYFKVPENELDKLRNKYEGLKILKGKKQMRERGFELEVLLNELFSYYAIEVFEPFRRNDNGEQIDGGVKLGDWYYLVECKWQKKLSDIRDLDSLLGKVNRSGRQTMGFFISMNGWSTNVPNLLKQNREKTIILINGDDLEAVLGNRIELPYLLEEKIKVLNLRSEPYHQPY